MRSLQQAHTQTASRIKGAQPESLLIIGSGSVGRRHLINAQSMGVSNVSVFSTGFGVPQKPIPENVRVETDLDAALSCGVEAAVLANPTSLHVPFALAAARAGCHLLIEKPLSHSSRTATR